MYMDDTLFQENINSIREMMINRLDTFYLQLEDLQVIEELFF